jgi:hypothetical protein
MCLRQKQFYNCFVRDIETWRWHTYELHTTALYVHAEGKLPHTTAAYSNNVTRDTSTVQKFQHLKKVTAFMETNRNHYGSYRRAWSVNSSTSFYTLLLSCPFLGAFAESRKEPTAFLSIRQSGSHLTDFREIWYWGLSRKHVEKIPIGEKCRALYMKT